MKPVSKYGQVLEHALLCVGSLLLAIFVLAYIDRGVMSRVAGPANINVLGAHGGDSLTLVTCYPFYFLGPAPQRYVVEASLNATGAAERRKETQLKGEEQ